MTSRLSRGVRTVLIVDDAVADRLAVKRGLQKQSERKLDFVEVASGKAALEEVARSRRFDLMITDYHLPDMTALELLHGLRADRELLPFPCIVVTGSQGQDMGERCLEAGAHDYIGKSRLSEPTLWRAVSYAVSRFTMASELLDRADELRALNRELERKNALQRVFLANATHELRTPVSAIAGLVELVEREPLPDQVRDYMRTIKSCCEALHSSIGDVLDLNRIEAGELVLEDKPISLSQVVEETALVLRRSAALKGLELSLRMEGLPPRVRGDARRIRQLLLNLGGNAVKFTERGGLSLRVYRLVEADGKRLDRYRFEVQDTGLGIPDREQDKVFERYFQATNARSGERGTGLGLAIAREIVELMAGRMGCASVLGEGSTFWFELPLPECSEPLETPKADGLSRGVRRNRILIAEDNAVLAHILSQQLLSLDQQVEVVSDGLEALRRFHPEAFDLAIFDARMPVMDGITACRELRLRYPESSTPIFILTADSMLNESQRRECGATNIFVKPISRDELVSLVLKRAPIVSP